MRAEGITQAGPAVTGAIQKASQLTGASFGYLVATAQVESNFNPDAKVSTSSAGGLFQFIDQTWLATLKEAGQTFGYGDYSKAISKTASGRYVVADPKMRRAVMRLRKDPTANSLMAGVFTRKNAAKLAAQIGRAPTGGELYLAHFLGPAGAAKLIGTASQRPGAAAAALFPGAARANPTIFYDRQGGARSVAQVYGLLTGKFDAAHARFAAHTPAAATAPAPVAAPDTAGIANAFAAVSPPPIIPIPDDGQVFHSLYRPGERRAPIDPMVNQLWAPPATAPAATASAVPSAPVATAAAAPAEPAQDAVTGLNLFQTQPTNARALFTRGGA